MRCAGLLSAALLMLGVGCHDPAAQMRRRPAVALDPPALDRYVAATPLSPDEVERRDRLAVSDTCSLHLWRVQGRAIRRMHRRHDVTLVVQSGQGRLALDTQRYVVRAGDVFHLPRGEAYSCENDGVAPLTMLLIFTPPYETPDTIIVPADARSYPRSGQR